MKLLMVDNYDSFTYNLVHYLSELGANVEVIRNDAMSVTDIIGKKPAGTGIGWDDCDHPKGRMHPRRAAGADLVWDHQ